MKKVSSLYIHFPFCRHLCNYCDFYKNESAQGIQLGPYQSYLVRSLAEHQKMMNEYEAVWAPLETLYVGGGTPSLWNTEGAVFLQSLLRAADIILAEDCEFTMEVNPGTLTEQWLSGWGKLGLNRMSVGVQSFDSRMLNMLDRAHDINDTHQTLAALNKRNFSVDFMIGLPNSKEYKRDVIEELKQAIGYGPKHFSVYILTTKDNYKFKQQLPDEEYVADEYLKVCELLEQNGFLQYEVSNFAMPGYESKHNMKYWMGHAVAALGPSATGLMRWDKDGAVRYKWKPQSPEAQKEQLGPKELALEDLYLNMRLNRPLDYRKFTHQSDWEVMDKLVDQWQEQLLVRKIDDLSFTLTPKGMLLQDGLMNDVFAQAKYM